MACMKSICELAREKDRTISVILMASLPAKFAGFSTLCWQLSVHDSLGCAHLTSLTAPHRNWI